MADHSALDEDSLSTLLARAKSLTSSLDTLEPQSDSFKETLATAITLLTQCQHITVQSTLFSPNESLEDVSTSSLPYLSIPFLLSELSLRTYSSDRKTQLREVVGLLEGFLGRCEDYGVLEGNDVRLWERAREEGMEFRVAGGEGKRDEKIRRFREEKALKERLRVLQEQSRSLNVDEDVARQSYLSEVRLYVHQSFQTLDMIGQEMEILASMPQPVPSRSNGVEAAADGRLAERTRDGYSERLDGRIGLSGRSGNGTGPLLDPKGKPLRPFTITDRRTQLQKGVFRPGHSLPTMSIDEYLEEERRRGGIVDGGGNADAPTLQPDEDDLNAQDEATMKAREWDEFVEANPKGAGNTLNRG